ncbi:MAG: Sir2 family NAD-dependent protein deacetylase [Nannocystaceae bacterium]
MNPALAELLDDIRAREGRVTFVTGAGISAESGIPTFRGAEGYWTVGAREYHPQEMATRATYDRLPRDVWHWYLYRRGVCRAAGPNDAHHALARLDERLGERLHLITQNVDGLHLQAGSPAARTYQVHGNIDFMRCGDGCSPATYPLPAGVPHKAKDERLRDDEFASLRCPRCGAVARPHILWFDECYDEVVYRADSAMRAAAACDLFITIGTSGAAALPMHATAEAANAGAAIVDINPADNPFAAFAREQPRGLWIRANACAILPAIVDRLTGDRQPV